MEFHYMQSFDDVEAGYKGIQEPKKADLACGEQALIIMPAVVVDYACNRIGYGGGYYDKYVATNPEYQSLLLAFDLQVVDFLPREPFDQPANMLVTETRIYIS
jgi:5-formyltetrahydrofolate cyclo-ligase